MLTLGNLKKLSELTENDMILVYTADGVKAISSQLFGAAVSPTTLYERFAKSIPYYICFVDFHINLI